jgi:hypothetical protein
MGRGRDWRRIVEEQEGSGLSVSDFCDERGLTASTFYLRRQQVRAAEAAPRQPRPARRPRFVPVVLPQDVTKATLPQQAPLSAVAPLELIHSTGVVLRIPAGCDVESLRIVLRLLDESREARPC